MTIGNNHSGSTLTVHLGFVLLLSMLCASESRSQLPKGPSTARAHLINGDKEKPQSHDWPSIDPAAQPPFDETTVVQEFPFVGDARPKSGQLWSYSTVQGSVRALTDLSVAGEERFKPEQSSKGVERPIGYGNQLMWVAPFDRTSADPKTRAIILPSFVRLHATTPDFVAEKGVEDEPEHWPQGGIALTIEVCATYTPPAPSIDGLPPGCVVSLHQYSYIKGFTNDFPEFRTYGFVGSLNAKGELVKHGVGGDQPSSPIPHRTARINPVLLPEGFLPGGSLSTEWEQTTHEINLEHIEAAVPGNVDNDIYHVRYWLNAWGDLYTQDQLLWAYVADPLDPDGENSGVRLETNDPPAQVSGRQCTVVYDDARYAFDGALVTDRYTALSWQRCPAGYQFDDLGTTDDPTDDRCQLDPAASGLYDWQGALSAAQQDATAGYTDWRVPNVKELETLVADCFSPMIEHEVFPDTPAGGAFWTSSPRLESGTWQVDFGRGDVGQAERSAEHYVRLVRDSGEAPIKPLPGWSAGGASVTEGDSGSVTLRFPVVLSTAASEAVSVSYEVASPNDSATPGVDFDEASGVVNLTPGQRRAEIVVTVYGDVEAEANEYVYLSLSNPSSNTRLLHPTGHGLIVDDEAVIDFAERPLQIRELDQDAEPEARIPVVLDKPANTTVTVDYYLLDDTARGVDGDYQGAAGTLIFNVGEQAATVDVTVLGDNVPENDETFIVRLHNPTGGKLAAGSGDELEQRVFIIDDDRAGTYVDLNDTAIVQCADATSASLPCPQANYPLQDAETGKDTDPTNIDADGVAGFVFTKLESGGAPLVDQSDSYSSTPWACVRDEWTDLVWETKTPSGSGLQAGNWTYSWYNSSGLDDGGDAGEPNGGLCVDQISCDSEKYIAAINSLQLCGFDDWRLPTIEELYTLADMSDEDLQFDAAFFPNQTLTASTGVWSATTAVTGSGLSDTAWQLNANGTRAIPKSNARHIRLVRGGVQVPF